MKRIRVLIVDDSVVYRSQIRSAIDGVGGIEVVGVAANGHIAIDKMRAHDIDLITLDLEMPVLDGLATLREMRQLQLKTKVIVFSSASQRGARVTLEALELGACDFVAKPNGENYEQSISTSTAELLRSLLVPKIENLFLNTQPEVSQVASTTASPFDWGHFKPSAIVIGSSTGGPTALETIFANLRGPFNCPIFIAQHMPPLFTASLAERLSKICGVPAAEGQNGEKVVANKVYVAPGNYHMQLELRSGEVVLNVNQHPQENSVRPAVDPLFRTAAEVYKNKCLGIILTGMGQDGLKGCLRLRESNSPVVIQNKESCVVFGMPGAVFQAAAYDSIQNLEQISETLRSCVQIDSMLSRGAS